MNNETKESLIRQIVTFFLITSIITTVIFIWMFNGAKENMVAILLMMWTPGISAFITSSIHKDRIRNYGWKPAKTNFLVYSYIIPLVASILGYGIIWLSGYAEFSTAEVINYKWAKMLGFDLPAPFLAGFLSKMTIGFLFTLIIVVGEEIGWSGFLTPKLLKIISVPVTSLIVGSYWAVWHYPAIIGGFYGTGTPLWVALPGFTLVCIAGSFIRTVLISKSKSLWVGAVLHASSNTILMGIFWEMTVHKGYAGYLVSETGVFLGVVYLIIALIFLKIQNKKIVIA